MRFQEDNDISDKVEISVTVEEFKGVKLHLSYEMKNIEGEVVCLGKSSHAFLNEEGKPIRMKQEYPELFEALNKAAQEK
ncbi:acyl-CoA thioesterase [Butyrivibrio sp. AD3002]|uniref:acyl-CoA thioesterase n=1 Tax=Butyrivibrio sp. AD3002 TaxID=1280670 RepID=UPI0004258F26|nr:hypothetical protein [Butyrivibrio sp. AD3002]